MDEPMFYNYDIEEIRSREFPALRGTTYVDHAGATLYAQSQLSAVQQDLSSNLYGNPHSASPSSRLTTDCVDQVRYRILKFFNTRPEDYTVIFTSGCTGALKLLAESFAYSAVAADSEILHDKGQTDKGVAPSINDDITASVRPNNLAKTHTVSSSSTKAKTASFVPLASTTATTGSSSSSSAGIFAYLQDNHTSAQGMREAAADRGKVVLCVTEEEVLHGLTEESVLCGGYVDKLKDTGGNGLFLFPGQSNFSGRKYPLSWVSDAQEGRLGFQQGLPGIRRWMVVIDAASLVSTSPVDLSAVCPDFVTLSFYKIFGFPTGLGALLVRNKSSWVMERRGYYGGGTVAASTARERFCVLRPNISDRFEDGTLPYLDILALRHGFDTLQRLAGGMEKISSHTFVIAQYLAHHLLRLRHANGAPLAQVYCADRFSHRHSQGAVVNFSLTRADGSYIGFAEVDKLAQLHDIHLRTGCFCNIGACQLHLGLASHTIKDNLDAGHVCGDDKDVINGRPTGSIRISFGYMSSLADAAYCLHFLVECFLETDLASTNKPTFALPEWFKPPVGVIKAHTLGRKMHGKGQTLLERSGDVSVVRRDEQGEDTRDGEKTEQREEEEEKEEQGEKEGGEGMTKCSEKERRLTDICVYPVKSCAAFKVQEWEVGERGLLYDRSWMIVTENGVALGQKREPRLCMLSPEVLLDSGLLQLSFPGVTSYCVPLEMNDVEDVSDVSVCTNKICNDRVKSVDCGDGVAQWLCQTLERPGLRLLRQMDHDGRQSKRNDVGHSQGTGDGPQKKGQLSLANESQYLVVCRQSVRSLRKKLVDAAEESLAETKDRDDDGDHMASLEVLEEDSLVDRFRANLVIDGGLPFEEDSWTRLQCSGVTFVSQGQCSRCGMICLDQKTGKKTREPLRMLVAWRGGKVYFGIYVRRESWQGRQKLKVGSAVTVAS